MSVTDLEAMLDEVMEQTVNRAFMAGWAAAQRKVSPYPDGMNAYQDWRGYGPGASLPGGYSAAEAIRQRDLTLAQARRPAPPDSEAAS